MNHQCLQAWGAQATALRNTLANLAGGSAIPLAQRLMDPVVYGNLVSLRAELINAVGDPNAPAVLPHQPGTVVDPTLQPDSTSVLTGLQLHCQDVNHAVQGTVQGGGGWLLQGDRDPVAEAEARALLAAVRNCLDSPVGPPPRQRTAARRSARRKPARKPARKAARKAGSGRARKAAPRGRRKAPAKGRTRRRGGR